MTAPIVLHYNREPLTDSPVYGKSMATIREFHPDLWLNAGQLWERIAEHSERITS